MLIPAHNPGPYLRQALDSVIGQLDERAEVLVFDDASTDGTAQLLQDTRARLDAEEPTARAGGWPTLRCIGQRPGVGVSAARNALLQAARGRWIWFLDADDCLRPGAVQAVRGVVQAHPGLQAVVVDHAVLRAAARLKHRLRGEGHRRSMPGRAGVVPCGALMEGLLARGQWHIWGKVLRRDAWPEDLRFPKGRVFEDLSVVPRLMAGIDVAWYLRQPLVDYRSNPTSILGSMNADKLRHWALALDDLAADPRFDRNWAEFVAQQALRLARVAQALPGRCDWIDGWWRALVQHQPLVLSALQSWRFRPRRWAAWWQARRLGWLRVQPPLVPREHGAPDDDDLDRST